MNNLQTALAALGYVTHNQLSTHKHYTLVHYVGQDGRLKTEAQAVTIYDQLLRNTRSCNRLKKNSQYAGRL